MSFRPNAPGNPLTSAGALTVLLEAAQHGDNICAERAAEHLHFFPDGGLQLPSFILGPIWEYCPLAAALALAKETPAVWNSLSTKEIEKNNFLIRTLACLLAFATADDNNYLTGPCMRGNYCKDWNPNYRLAVVTPMLFLGRYLGGAKALDRVLAAFSYDETVSGFRKYGMTRAIVEWTVPAPTLPDGTKSPLAKDFLENGGPAYLVHVGDSIAARLQNYEGKPAGDGNGIRSGLVYCTHDFAMVCCALLTLRDLHMFDLRDAGNAVLYARMQTGSADYLYKAAHGYMSFTTGSQKEEKSNTCGCGYPFWKAWWQENYGTDL